MVDRIEKNLRKVDARQRQELTKIIERILQGSFQGLDIKKLQGSDHIFRIRKGKFRVIFSMKNEEDISILAVERRGDHTYYEW